MSIIQDFMGFEAELDFGPDLLASSQGVEKLFQAKFVLFFSYRGI